MLESTTNLGAILAPGKDEKIVLLDLGAPENRQSYTRKSFDDLCNSVAGGLLEAGYSPGDHIGLMSANRAEFMIAYFAIMRAGMIAVPFNHRLASETINTLFATCDVKLSFCDSERAKILEGDGKIVVFGTPEWESFCCAAPTAIREVEHEAIAKMLFTSGSTGLPKGVPLSHGGSLWALRHFAPEPAPEGEMTLNPAPLFHKNGLFNSTVALARGSTMVMMPSFEPKAYLKAVDKYRIGSLSGVPTMFALLARETELLESLDVSCVTKILVGSAPLSAELLSTVKDAFPNAEITNAYGLTEVGPAIFGPHPDGIAQPQLSIGYPMDEIDWRLEDGNEYQGTLHMRTPAMTNGYFKRPELNETKFVDGWYNSGDIVRRDENGFFYFVGRADDMFVSSGENIYPSEVERMLEQHPAVSQAVIVPAPDDIKGMVPAAFVVRSASADPISEEDLKAYSIQNGPAYQHPRYVEFVEAVPLASTNKIDSKLLRNRARDLATAAGRYTGR